MNGGMAQEVAALLLLAFHTRIIAPDADSGLDEVARRAGHVATPDQWRASVTEALAADLIYDPVRVPAGALQCHWHLELTQGGVEVARRLRRHAPQFEE